jgi:hypothetical protein
MDPSDNRPRDKASRPLPVSGRLGVIPASQHDPGLGLPNALREAVFYGAMNDSAGPIRPSF